MGEEVKAKAPSGLPPNVFENDPPNISDFKCDFCRGCGRLNLPTPVKTFVRKGFQILPLGKVPGPHAEGVVETKDEARKSGEDFREVWVYRYNGDLQVAPFPIMGGRFCSILCLNNYATKKLKEEGLFNAEKRTVRQ